jgi:hypothetical protein
LIAAATSRRDGRFPPSSAQAWNLLKSFLWGLVPFWAKDPSIGGRLINARAETVAQKPSFKQAFARRRCLIPADGFYEWKKEGGKKIPYCFGLKSGVPLYFAGLYEKWTAPDQKPVESCTIITTQANETVAPVQTACPSSFPLPHTRCGSIPRFRIPAVARYFKTVPAEEMNATGTATFGA